MNKKILITFCIFAVFATSVFVMFLSKYTSLTGNIASKEAQQICEPKEVKCFGNELHQCSIAGTTWSLKKTCKLGCENNECTKPNFTPDDLEFVRTSYDITILIQEDIRSLKSAFDNFDLVEMERRADTLYEDSLDALSQMEDFEVSADLMPIKTLMVEWLHNCRSASFWYSQGTKSLSSKNIETGTYYIEKAASISSEINEIFYEWDLI